MLYHIHALLRILKQTERQNVRVEKTIGQKWCPYTVWHGTREIVEGTKWARERREENIFYFDVKIVVSRLLHQVLRYFIYVVAYYDPIHADMRCEWTRNQNLRKRSEWRQQRNFTGNWNSCCANWKIIYFEWRTKLEREGETNRQRERNKKKTGIIKSTLIASYVVRWTVVVTTTCCTAMQRTSAKLQEPHTNTRVSVYDALVTVLIVRITYASHSRHGDDTLLEQTIKKSYTSQLHNAYCRVRRKTVRFSAIQCVCVVVVVVDCVLKQWFSKLVTYRSLDCVVSTWLNSWNWRINKSVVD